MKPDAAADRRWMRAALAEARRSEGQTRPNPPVGAVLVRDGRLLATGYHHAAGRPHAEVEAFAACAEDPAGATLYVTLEPCSTHGRTPPCTDRIVAAGVRRVVIATVDPNPRHVGYGIEVLRAAGIEVEVGVLTREADALLDPFGKWITTGRPFLTLKMAQSLDGAVADAEGRSQWITGPQARAEVQRLRRRADAVMVGAGTVLADDPSLLCRLPGAPPSLHRVVVDGRGRTPASARVLTDGQAARTTFATTEACPLATREAWQAAGARVWVLPQEAHANPDGIERNTGVSPVSDGIERSTGVSPVSQGRDAHAGRVDLCALTAKAGAEGWLHLLCEGGATLAGALVAAGLVDELRLFVAPVVLGARKASTFGNAAFALASAPRFRITAQRKVGADLMLTLRPPAEASTRHAT